MCDSRTRPNFKPFDVVVKIKRNLTVFILVDVETGKDNVYFSDQLKMKTVCLHHCLSWQNFLLKTPKLYGFDDAKRRKNRDGLKNLLDLYLGFVIYKKNFTQSRCLEKWVGIFVFEIHVGFGLSCCQNGNLEKMLNERKLRLLKKYLLYSLLSRKKYPCKTADQMRRLNWVIWKLKNTNAFNFGHNWANSRNHDHRLLPNSKKNVWNFLSSEFLHCNSRSPKRNRAPSCQMGECLY